MSILRQTFFQNSFTMPWQGNLEVLWPNIQFLYYLVNSTLKICPLCKFDIGKILIYNTMHVVTYVKVECIGKIKWKLMAATGEGGLWAKPPESLLLTMPVRLLENTGNTF